MARTISLRRFRRLAVFTTVCIGLIVVAGGAVRLTGSGLGCDDWPNCNSERFIDVSTGHAAVEQINRIFSGLIGIPVLALAITAFFVRPRRSGLRWPAVALLLTVLANAVVGGMAVRGDLHPALVQSHFLLAMATISLGMILIRRSEHDKAPDDRPAVERRTALVTLALAVTTGAALFTGTLVTGAGPHAGDETARRFGFDISTVAEAHSVNVLVAVGIGVLLAWTLRNDPGAQRHLGPTLSSWIFVALLQGVVGYTQYFTGVPALLVGVHIALATVLWAMTMRLATRALSATDTQHAGRIHTGVIQHA